MNAILEEERGRREEFDNCRKQRGLSKGGWVVAEGEGAMAAVSERDVAVHLRRWGRLVREFEGTSRREKGMFLVFLRDKVRMAREFWGEWPAPTKEEAKKKEKYVARQVGAIKGWLRRQGVEEEEITSLHL